MPDSAYPSESEPLTYSIDRTEAGEAILSNQVTCDTAITICVPCYRDHAAPLLSGLSRLAAR